MNRRGRIIRFTWDEWKWMAIIIMLGVNMYWTAINIEPNRQQLEQAAVTQQQIKDRAIEATEQNADIIDVMNNNTERLEDIIANQSKQVQILVNLDTNVSDMRDVLLLQDVKPNQTLIERLIEKEMRTWVANITRTLSS